MLSSGEESFLNYLRHIRSLGLVLVLLAMSSIAMADPVADIIDHQFTHTSADFGSGSGDDPIGNSHECHVCHSHASAPSHTLSQWEMFESVGTGSYMDALLPTRHAGPPTPPPIDALN